MFVNKVFSSFMIPIESNHYSQFLKTKFVNNLTYYCSDFFLTSKSHISISFKMWHSCFFYSLSEIKTFPSSDKKKKHVNVMGVMVKEILQKAHESRFPLSFKKDFNAY